MTTSRGTAAGGRPDGGAAGSRRRLELAGLARPSAAAKAFTRRALADWAWDAGAPGVDDEVAEDVVLVVAELVANAVVHAGGPLAMVLDASGSRLRIEVSDGSDEPPAPRRHQRAAQPGGHGLLIVERATDRWGADRRERAKTVWAEVDVARLCAGRSPGPSPSGGPERGA
ncbi:ATP-binding protein [Streptomyces sp. NPDC089919]|uniref:ATP-binding protein n=1 Tax=Streptomyces sp. NPDC089919 TaxID=3155188 RepID=UPI00344503A8